MRTYLMVLSPDPEASVLPSRLTATQNTRRSWPINVALHSPLFTSQILGVKGCNISETSMPQFEVLWGSGRHGSKSECVCKNVYICIFVMAGVCARQFGTTAVSVLATVFLQQCSCNSAIQPNSFDRHMAKYCNV